MLDCPYCQRPVSEGIDACPECGFSLASLSKVLGIPPKLNHHLHDFTRALPEKQQSRIRQLLKSDKRNRPGNSYHLVISNQLDERVPLPVHGFWLLNKGGLCRAVESGGACYDLLVLVAPNRAEVALCVGYGIEFLVAKEELDQVLAKHLGKFRDQNYFNAMQALMRDVNALIDRKATTSECLNMPLVNGDRIIPIDGDGKPSEPKKSPEKSPY